MITKFKVGQPVFWTNCPQSIALFAHNCIVEIRAEQAKLYFIRNWIPLKDLRIVKKQSDQDARFFAGFAPNSLLPSQKAEGDPSD